MSTSAETTAPRPVSLDIAGVVLNGDLSLPSDAHGLVVFAHGAGVAATARAIAPSLRFYITLVWARSSLTF